MTKNRLIPLLFALAYIVIPPSAVYLQVSLSNGDANHAMQAPAAPITPAVLRVGSAEPDRLVTL